MGQICPRSHFKNWRTIYLTLVKLSTNLFIKGQRHVSEGQLRSGGAQVRLDLLRRQGNPSQATTSQLGEVQGGCRSEKSLSDLGSTPF